MAECWVSMSCVSLAVRLRSRALERNPRASSAPTYLTGGIWDRLGGKLWCEQPLRGGQWAAGLAGSWKHDSGLTGAAWQATGEMCRA